MTTEFWNVPAALAWIAAKDEGICKRLQSKGNATFIDVIAEVRPKYPDIACPTRALTLELEERLRAGEVTSHAVRNQSGRREPIPPLDWPGLSLTVGPNGSGVVAESGILSGLKLVLSEILISVDDIIIKGFGLRKRGLALKRVY